MTFDYAEVAATSAEILEEFGAPVTIRNYTIGTYDPATGGTTSTFSDVVKNGVLLDFAAGRTLGPGGLIQAGDKRLLLEPGTVPALEDHVVVQGGVEYVIKGIGEVNPAGVPVLYELHLRS